MRFVVSDAVPIPSDSAGAGDPCAMNRCSHHLPQLHVNPTLAYSYTSGYTITQGTSQAVTVGVTQSFNYMFFPGGPGGATTLSASGTFTWTSGTSVNRSTIIANSVAAPFDVPAGKIYEEKLVFDQQQVQVPYTVPVFVDGLISGGCPLVSGLCWSSTIGSLVSPQLLSAYQQLGITFAPYKDVNWSDVQSTSDVRPGIDEMEYLLHGTLTMAAASTFTVQLFDITNGGVADVADLVSQYSLPLGGLGSAPPTGGGQPVPEPSSFAALATGLLGLGLAADKKRIAARWAWCRGVLGRRTGDTS